MESVQTAAYSVTEGTDDMDNKQIRSTVVITNKQVILEHLAGQIPDDAVVVLPVIQPYQLSTGGKKRSPFFKGNLCYSDDLFKDASDLRDTLYPMKIEVVNWFTREDADRVLSDNYSPTSKGAADE